MGGPLVSYEKAAIDKIIAINVSLSQGLPGSGTPY